MSNDVLIKALGKVESGNNPKAMNKQSSATGEIQMMWSQWGNRIKEFANNPNLTREEFANDANLQKKWADHYVKTVLEPEAKKLQTRYPNELKQQGLTNPQDVQTLLHFQGYPRSAKFLKTGKEEPTKAANMSVKDYIQKTRQARDELSAQSKSDDIDLGSADDIDLGEIEPTKETETVEPSVSEFEAGIRGLAQGLSFGFADEITAAAESALTGKPYRQAVEESRKEYEKAAKERPGLTLGGEFVGGAASSFIPGVGVLGRGAQIAAAATKGKRIAEIARGGAQLGAVAGLGASEDITKPLETAADVALGAATGGAVGAGLGKLAQTEAAQKISKRLGETAGKLTEKLSSKRWQIPEFVNDPASQQRVDQLVAVGKRQNLTDRQILNTIANEFPEIPVNSLEQAFTETGLKGAIKRRVAGSQEATEFIERPEQLARAERIQSGKSAEMSRLEQDLGQAEAAKLETQRGIKQLRKETQRSVEESKNNIAALYDEFKTEQNLEKRKSIEDKLRYNLEKLKMNTGIEERQAKIQRLKEIDEQNAKTVATEIERLTQEKSQEQLDKVLKLRNKLNDQVKDLAGQREALVEDLQNVEATPEQTENVLAFSKELLKQFEDIGMGRDAKRVLNDAFSGDNRFWKLQSYLQVKEDQAKWDASKIADEYNKAKGLKFGDAGYKITDAMVYNDGKPRPQDPEIIPSIGDIVGGLLAANKKISSAEYGTQLATIKRKVAEQIQERMKDFSEEAYQLQRQIGSTRANIGSIEKSPFFKSYAIPTTGPTGRVSTGRKAFVKTELPDLSKMPEDYKRELTRLGVNVGEMESILEQEAVVKRGLERSLSQPEINKLETQIAQMEKEQGFKVTENEKKVIQNRLLLNNARRELDLKQQEYRKLIQEKKAASGEKLAELEDRSQRIKDDLNILKDRRDELSQTESELSATLKGTMGEPTSVRDIGQVAVIGSKGQIPFGIGKLIPSAKTRIKTLNQIKNRFANPSLNSALRMALERPVTLETVRQLSTTHKVSEQELTDALIGAGVQIVDLLGPSTAYGSGGSSILALPEISDEENAEPSVRSKLSKQMQMPTSDTTVDVDKFLDETAYRDWLRKRSLRPV
jgi:hypothetical protein